MGDKDAKFTFGPTEPAADKDPTVRDVHRLELEQTHDEPRIVGGYNPYDRDVKGKAPAPAASSPAAPAKRTSTTTRTDLRKLSEWIKLRKEVEARKNSETSEPEPVPTVKLPRPKF